MGKNDIRLRYSLKCVHYLVFRGLVVMTPPSTESCCTGILSTTYCFSITLAEPCSVVYYHMLFSQYINACLCFSQITYHFYFHWQCKFMYIHSRPQVFTRHGQPQWWIFLWIISWITYCFKSGKCSQSSEMSTYVNDTHSAVGLRHKLWSVKTHCISTSSAVG